MPAILSVTYTPNYPGNHRICFRTTQPSYCCYNDDSTSVVGVPKTTQIELEDFELCLQDLPAEVGCAGSTVEGYIQPICVEQGSDVNRVAFIATFPATSCTPYEILCTESGIGEFLITDPGYGWPVGVTPTITVNDSSGFGNGFVGTVNMLCEPGENFCSIESITIDDSGQAYYLLNALSVDINPLPSCESNELIINGNFIDGFNNWTVTPNPDGWLLTAGNVPYYNIATYTSTGGDLTQNVLTPGKTYLIDFEKVIVKCAAGTVKFIVAAGLFSPFTPSPNAYVIELNAGDPDQDGPLTITLDAFGASNFTIYAEASVDDPGNRASFTRVSVIEVCDVVLPEIEVSMVDDCGTFTVTDCDGTANPTTYQLWGGTQYAINVCSGGTGPEGPKYTITSNPVDVSCCDCVKYDVINTALTEPFDYNYVDCLDQTIKTVTIQAQETQQVCAVVSSVWPVDAASNQFFEYVVSGIQDC